MISIIQCFKYTIYISILTFFTALHSDYEFKGKHYIASYKKCDPYALRSLSNLIDAFSRAIYVSGATVVGKCHHKFDNDALTSVYLLSESHASIHTYPEHNSCFVDLFTCGDTCDWSKFHCLMMAYLNPEEYEFDIIERS